MKCPTDAELQSAQAVIDRQVLQMTRLVDDLLDVSRITRGKVKLEMEPVELATAIERAIETSQPLINGRKHRLTVGLPDGSIAIFGDLARLAQVFANILNNAAKYSEEGGLIKLTVEREEREVVIRIRDTGVGIAAEMLPRVFELFSQAQGSLSRSEGGLGIGLSLVRSLVEMHGGSVSAASSGIGCGSEFTVRLPMMEGVVAPARTDLKAALRVARIRPRRILVVDDNVDAAESLALLLRVSGHNVRTAHDGAAAMELAQAEAPEVALLDIGLPRVDGLEVARRFREDLGLTEVLLVALTGYGQDEDRRRSLGAGFNAHVVKPVDYDALQELLARSEAPQPLSPS